MGKRDPYPLQWPSDWKRSVWREMPKFQAQFARDRDNVIRQLQRMGGSHIVITSDLPTRNDGLPYANATCSDPGVAVYWVKKGKEMVIACDRWRHVTQNLRAVDMTLEALRGIDRWGASTMVEKAFAGFAALPPGSGETIVPPTPTKRRWREVLGDTFGPWPQLAHDELLVLAKSRYRKLIQLAHPDAGGSHERAAEINAALAEAETELTFDERKP
jgi:hypothetical protein